MVNGWMVMCKIKTVSSTLPKGYTCVRCIGAIKGIVEPAGESTFNDQV